MKRILIIFFVSSFIYQAHAYTLSVGIFGGTDSRDEADDGNIYGFSAAILWGGSDLKVGLGAHKSLQKVNDVLGGYETFSLNFHYAGFYVNPFYGRRAIKTSELFESNNLYSTQGATFGYDFFLSKGASLGVGGIYEKPGELDSTETNPDYIKLKSNISPTLTLKFWW